MHFYINMKRYKTIFPLLAMLIFSAIGGFEAASAPSAKPAGPGMDILNKPVLKQKTEPEKPLPVSGNWQREITPALNEALMNFKPVLIFFSSKSCPWSRKMSEETFADKEIKKALESFVTVIIDADEDRQILKRYFVRHVPTVIFVSPELGEIGRIEGFAGKKSMLKHLNELTTANIDAKAKTFDELTAKIEYKKMKKADWEKAMRTLGWSSKYRRKMKDMIFAMKKFPAKELVKLLENKQLAVRLGAIELLEDYHGESYGYDPWFGKTPSSQVLEAIGKWKKWAALKKVEKRNTTPLTKERYNVLINNALSAKPGVAARAALMLRNGGLAALAAIREFQKDNKNLAPGLRMKLRELEYVLVLSQLEADNPTALAHRLIYGNQDTKTKALMIVKSSGPPAMEIIRDYLNDPEPLIRETAIDAIVAAGKAKALPYFKELLKSEKNVDVLFCLIRNLGEVKTKESAVILFDFLNNPSEDLVIAALGSIADIKGDKKGERVIKFLKDPRWRVQVAALDAVRKIELKNAAPQVKKLLNSKDEYVRLKAISTISSLKLKNISGILSKMYLKDDSLKPAIIAAYGELDMKLPESFTKGLAGKDKSLLLQASQALKESPESGFGMLKFLAKNPDEDVSCSAIGIIAGARKLGSKKYIYLYGVLKQHNRKKILALLKNFYVSSDDYKILKIYLKPLGNNNREKKKDLKQVEELFNAFDVSDKPKASKPKEKTVGFDELLDSFGAEEKTGKKDVGENKAIAGIAEILKRNFEQGKDREIRYLSAVALVRLRMEDSLKFLNKIFKSQPSEKKQEIIRALSSYPVWNHEFKKLIFQAINDKDKKTAELGKEALFECKDKKALEFILEQFANNKKIEISQFSCYELKSILTNSRNRRRLWKWAVKVLRNPKSNHDAKVLALYLLKYRKNTTTRELLTKYAESPDIWIKRSALFTMGNIYFNDFAKIAENLISDKSTSLRVLPAIIARKSLSNDYDDKLFFDLKHSMEFSSWSSSLFGSSRQNNILSSKYIKLLKELASDISPRVRLDAFFALMNAGEKVDPRMVLKTINKFQDKNAISKQVTDFFEDNYSILDKSYKILLPFVSERYTYSSKYKSIMKHFLGKPTVAVITKYKLRSGGEKISATVARKLQPKKTDSIKLVYFTKKGCQDCKKVDRYLGIIKSSFPELNIETFDIKKVKSMRLNEAYCEKFNVPAKSRLVAPAIFSGAGYLVKSEVDFDKLGQLVGDSSGIPLSDWYVVNKKELEKSEQRISTRYRKIKTGVILLAGLFDGINPCAFATIIFFISYMLISRKEKKEIIQVSGAFIAGVFIAYYLMGLGLTEFITRFAIIEVLGLWFNWIMAAMVLIIMLLSIYDGILCLRGKIDEIKLQLPNFLKERIRQSIRAGAKNYHFVFAAFITGVIVSFLELACTGQVYAPTILFMLKTGSGTFQAYYLLALYNLAFVAPLILIFIMTYFGMKSETLIRLFRSNAALVKFGTALLFLVIFLLLVFEL